MADGYARVTGRPGVCFIITGPGMTNILTAMGQALRRFRADAGDLQRQPHRAAGAWARAGCTSCRRSRRWSAGVAAFSHTVLHAEPAAGGAGAGVRAVRQRPAAAGAHRDPDRRDHRRRRRPAAGRRARCPAPPVPDRRRDRAVPQRCWRRAARPLLMPAAAPCGGAEARGAGRAAGRAGDQHRQRQGHPAARPSAASPARTWPGRRCARRCARPTSCWPSAPSSARPRCTRARGPLRFDGKLIRIDIDPRAAGARLSAPACRSSAIAPAWRLSALLPLVTRDQRRRCGAGARRCARPAPRCGGRRCARTGACLGVVQRRCPTPIIVGDLTQPVYAGNQFFARRRPRSLVQLEHRLRHAGLRAAGGDRREARGAGIGRWWR